MNHRPHPGSLQADNRRIIELEGLVGKLRDDRDDLQRENDRLLTQNERLRKALLAVRPVMITVASRRIIDQALSGEPTQKYRNR